MANSNNIITTILGVAESPEDIALIAALGNFLQVLAAHNVKHFGSANQTVANLGKAVSGFAGTAQALGGMMSAGSISSSSGSAIASKPQP